MTIFCRWCGDELVHTEKALRRHLRRCERGPPHPPYTEHDMCKCPWCDCAYTPELIHCHEQTQCYPKREDAKPWPRTDKKVTNEPSPGKVLRIKLKKMVNPDAPIWGDFAANLLETAVKQEKNENGGPSNYSKM